MNSCSLFCTGNRRTAMRMACGVLLVVSVVSCGPASNKTENKTRGEGGFDPKHELQAFAQCMRDNGLTNYPEPTENGINLKGTGIDRGSPVFQAAEKACSALLPQPPQGPAQAGGPGERRRGGDQDPEGRGNRSGVRTEWTKVTPGGDCACADGSGFAFWDHKADPTKVVLYLDGGGVCFDPATCAAQNTPTSGEREGPDYDPNIDGEFPDQGGMLDLARAENPFHGYSAIYVPLCTADAFLGNNTHEYAPGLIVNHKGFVNGSAALHYLTTHYAGAAQVVVIGKTAGATAAPIYAGLIADQLPGARVVAFGGQSGAFPNDPDLNARIAEMWGALNTMPDWDVNKGLTARDWGSRRSWIQSGLHNPNLVLARFDYAFDPNATQTLEYLAIPGVDPSNTLAIIDANEAAIETAGVTLHSYTAPGEGHGIFEFEIFYEMEVNGVRLVDWLKALVDGKSPSDVHCDPCKE